VGRAFSRSSLARRLRRLRGIIVQMAAELLKHETGTDLLVVPFKGGQPATLALLSGEVDMIVNDLTGLKSNVASGKLRALRRYRRGCAKRRRRSSPIRITSRASPPWRSSRWS